jgi:hypothetical protein
METALIIAGATFVAYHMRTICETRKCDLTTRLVMLVLPGVSTLRNGVRPSSIMEKPISLATLQKGMMLLRLASLQVDDSDFMKITDSVGADDVCRNDEAPDLSEASPSVVTFGRL